MSSPSITLSPEGIVSWTNPETPPYSWIIEQCLQDGTHLFMFNRSVRIDGSLESFDAAAEWYYKGVHICLFGVDDQDHLILTPSKSSTPLVY
jgi:hypothetical protein